MKILIATYPEHVPKYFGHDRKMQFIDDAKLESDVALELLGMGHTIEFAGVRDNVSFLIDKIKSFKPEIVFNLLDEFYGEGLFDQHVASLFELLKVSYTGCNPRGLMFSRDKLLSKQILSSSTVEVPKGFTVENSKLPEGVVFPVIVKSLTDEGSKTIAQASIVKDQDSLQERIRFLLDQGIRNVLVEEFIEGREIYVGVIGNEQIQTFAVWEVLYAL